jgi:acetyl esterase
MTPAEARESIRLRSAALPRPEVASVRDVSLPVPGGRIIARVFTPVGPPPLPALVYFHGGGWVTGDLDTHDGICRTLVNEAGAVVASIDYRRAPEFAYPTAAEDAYAATAWVAANAGELGVDRGRLAVVGDSAGGNLAAVVSLMARDRHGPVIALQALIYPVTDCDFERSSYRECGDGYLLTRAAMRHYWDQYAPGLSDRQAPYAAPLRATDLTGLPPALVITAEYDPLRDEGEVYAARLRDAGVSVTLSRYPGQIHGFFRYVDVMDQARQAVAEVADAIRKRPA